MNAKRRGDLIVPPSRPERPRRAPTAGIARTCFAVGPLLVPFALAAVAAAQSSPPALPDSPTAIQRGVEYLLKSQNPDGSWGGPRESIWTFTGDVWSNPETHRSWQVATTGLCTIAILEADAWARPPAPRDGASSPRDAAIAALDYLLRNANVKRPNEWDTMNTWAYIYALQALASAHSDPRLADAPLRGRIAECVPRLIHGLRYTQSLNGGWGYLEFDEPRTAQPQWATSFTTASGIVALCDARAAGLPIDEAVLGRAVRAVQRCRLPGGVFTYSVPAIADPRHSEWIDQVKGSLGRTQACHVALLLAGEAIPVDKLTAGLDNFFRYHRFLDIARNRPIPHETYYYNSGYFYLFGHYYAARLIQRLPPESRAAYRPRLQREVIKLQNADGSLYDYDMHAYHKPYGTAFGIMTLTSLLQSTVDRPEQPAP